MQLVLDFLVRHAFLFSLAVAVFAPLVSADTAIAQSLQENYLNSEGETAQKQEYCRQQMLNWHSNTTYDGIRVINGRVYHPSGDGANNHVSISGGTICTLKDLGPFGIVFLNRDGRQEQWSLKDGDSLLCNYLTRHDGSIGESCYDRIYPGQV